MTDLGEAQRLLLAQERASERLRIARDLHDDLGHGLTAIGLMAATAELEASGSADRARAAALKHEASGLLSQLRSTVTGLRSDTASTAGHIDLGRALAAVGGAGHWRLAVHVDVRGEATLVEAERGIAIVRLVREALTNAARHAGASATEVRVTLDAVPERLAVSVRDDGCGAAAHRFGNGLSGMRERIEALGGDMQLETGLGKGWAVRATIPQCAP